MIFFTADLHLGHQAILNYCGRPFQTKEEHDQALINNWNSVIQKGDIVYCLGDFGFGPQDYLCKIASKLRGQINLIRGNHDHGNIGPELAKRFVFIKDVHLLKTKYKDHTVRIWLSHYAHRVWPQWNYGTIHLFGHSHGNMPSYGKSMDIGTDCNNYYPFSLGQVMQKMETLPMLAADAKVCLGIDPEENL